MAKIVVIGAGLGGLPVAYELRHLLPQEHQITLIANQAKFTFVPSLPWVGLGLKPLQSIQLDLAAIVPQHGIEWLPGQVEAIDPSARQLKVNGTLLGYDYVVIATGPELALDALPGLGPETGYSQSVCNPHHALLAREAWEQFLEAPGPMVVGAAPGASCFGPAYEFALLANHVLHSKKLRDRVPMTLVTSEPYAGHLGIGGMANSRWLIKEMLAHRQIEVLDNTAIARIEPDQIILANGNALPCQYSMVLPPFRGPKFLREIPGLTDAKGFVPVLPTYRHPDFDSVYAVGVVTQLKPPESTPIPIGVPKVGQMIEEMAMAVAHNLALALGVRSGSPLAPTLQAICFADFGDNGALFFADPLLPNPLTGKRHRSFTTKGIWISWVKAGFEQYFMNKMRLGWAMPWFERLALRAIGLPLVMPLEQREEAVKVMG